MSNSPRRRIRLTSNPLSRLGQQANLLTIKERAAAIGLSPGYLAHIERGACLPSPEVVERMAVAYKTTAAVIERAANSSRKTLAQRILDQTEEQSRDTA